MGGRIALLLALAALAPARGIRMSDFTTPAPLPGRSLVVIGFLGAWERWDNPRRSVRKLALSLREKRLPGVYVETADNHSRDVVLKFLKRALDGNGDGKVDAAEARVSQVILYGQSFGGAACVKLARELQRLGVTVRLTVQVDSVGRGDAVIPPNVLRAVNLYQRDPGPIRGESRIRAADPSKTEILGNIRFSYLFRSVDMTDYPAVTRRAAIPHWKMDNDPVVWRLVEAFILTEIARWQTGE
jgi:hypothetical protein